MKRASSKIAAAYIALVLATAAAMQARAQTFTIIYSFTGTTDGGAPEAPLVMDQFGNLYGTTFERGSSNNCFFGCGTVFKLDPFGSATVLHSFLGDATDGGHSFAGLVRDAAGNLYGTTEVGGTTGFGTVFKIDPAGNETIIHNFMGPPSDGAVPTASLVLDASGSLYGTTSGGGSSPLAFHGFPGLGTVFKIDPVGNETVLHNFNSVDGDAPVAGLLMDSAGNLYGTTSAGGIGLCVFGCGVVFRVDPSGNESVLYNFEGQSDGSTPFGNLIMDAAGNLYGTTFRGGVSTTCNGCGTVFKLDTSGNESLLYTFKGGSDGANPAAGLLMDGAGNLYGTTSDNDFAAPGLLGTVFKIDPAGHEAVLHNFTGGRDDGQNPRAALIMDAAGNLYGTTEGGGAFLSGIVFKVSAQTPQQATQAIIDAANALFAQGVLNKGQDNSLVKKLQHAINLMNAADNADAIDNLNAFINEVNGLLSAGIVSSSQAASLINAAQNVIARLS
jgi:uncharacterized repeat protein (TIGR03803 family)